MSAEREPPKLDLFTLEEVTKFARESALQLGHHIPTLIVQGTEASFVGPVPNLPDTHTERVDLMGLIGFLTAQEKPMGQLKQVFMIAEGWLSVTKEKDEIPEIPPSQDPQRKEVLLISNLNVGNNTSDLVILEMIRDQNQTLIDLQATYMPQDTEKQTINNPLLEAFVEGFSFGENIPPTDL